MAKYLTAPVARKAGAHNHLVRRNARSTRSRACSPRSSARSHRRCSSTSSAKQLAVGREDPRPTTRVIVSDDSDDEDEFVVTLSDFEEEDESDY